MPAIVRIFSLSRLLSVTPAFLLALMSQACATGSGQVIEYLDQRTAVTVTRAAQPLTFSARQPLLGANARDLVYAGPVDINRMGEHSLYLWLAFGSLIGRSESPVPGQPTQAGVVHFWVDGEPMELHRKATASGQIGAGRDPYPVGPAVTHEGYYPITTSQLARIAEANSLQLTAPGFAEPPQRFELWTDRRECLVQFMEYFAGY